MSTRATGATTRQSRDGDRINAVMSAVGYNLRPSSDLRGPTGATVPPQSQVVEQTLAQNHRRNLGRDNASINAQTRVLTTDYPQVRVDK